MKQLFFQKGTRQQFSPNGQWLVETSSNLDSKKYILERIPIDIYNQEQNYISNHYFFARQDNLILYFGCWKQSQNVPNEKPIAKQKDKKKDKKTMLDIIKRKTIKVDAQQTIAPSKKKIIDLTTNQNFILQQFIYIQMEYFSEIQVPNDFAGARDLLIVIYLLGKRIEKKTGSFPCLIPVKNQQNDRIKFFKKGISPQIELSRVMIYLFKDKQQAYLREWSSTMEKVIHKAMINHDQFLIGNLLRNSIEEYLKHPHSICLVKQEQKICSIQTVRILNFETLLLEQSEIELPLDEYTIEYLLKSQSDRQITLTHEIFERYILSGKKSNLIVKWLFNMAT